MNGLITLDRVRPVVKVEDRDWVLVGAVVDELIGFARTQLAKARLPKAVRERDALLAEVAPSFREELVEYFGSLLREAGIRKADDLSDVDEGDVDWQDAEAALTKIIRKLYVKLGDAAAAAIGKELGVELTFDIDGPATAPIRDAIATKVTGITDRTRQLIVDYVTTATDRGYSMDQLVNGVEDDGFLGLGAIFADRAQAIALTETATAYNLASVATYRDSGLVDQVLIFDGDECGWTEHDDPDLADGSIRDLDDYEDYPVSHPNCQRSAGPIVAGDEADS